MIIVTGVNVGTDSNSTVEIKVDVGPYLLRGQLLNSNGRPIANADLQMVHVNNTAGIETTTSRTATSQQDGTFEFGGLSAGAREIIVASQANGNTSFLADPAQATAGVIVLP